MNKEKTDSLVKLNSFKNFLFVKAFIILTLSASIFLDTLPASSLKVSILLKVRFNGTLLDLKEFTISLLLSPLLIKNLPAFIFFEYFFLLAAFSNVSISTK